VIGIKPGTKEIRVLIADDHEENRLVLRELLEPLGILTQSAENGKIALETAITWKPDLILMDLRMPIMNGFEAAKRIKATIDGKNIHIIAVTASILELDKHKVNESGMTGYLRKPFKDYELFSMLESKLGSIFTYGDPINTTRDKVEPDTTTLTPESMAIIPQEIIDQMGVATTNARFEELVALIDKVSAFSPQTASKLRNLANDYQYDFLLKLFKKGEEDGD
jgi:CheY-like chemotaxis protein